MESAQTNPPESMGVQSRVLAMASCLADAKNAYKEANIEPTGEDIRTVAISFFIDMNKNGRMDRMEHKSNATSVASSAPSTPSAPVQTGNLGVCNKCGAPMKMSMKGKAYCSATCWKK